MPPRGQNNGATNELRKITAEYKKLLGEIKKMTATIAKMGPGGAKVDMKEQVRQAEVLRRTYEEIIGFQQDGNAALSAAKSDLKDYAKTLQDIKKGSKDILTTELQLGDHVSKLSKEREGIQKFLNANAKDLTKDQLKALAAMSKDLKLQIQANRVQEQRARIMQKNLKASMDNLSVARDFGLEVINSIDSAIAKLPGGQFLSKLLGADRLKEQFSAAFNKGVLAYIEPGGSVSAGMKAFNDALKLSKGLIILGIAAALASAVALLGKLEASAKEYAMQTGIARDQAFALETSIRAREYSEANSLASNKEIADVLAVQVAEFGRLGTMSATTASKTVQIGEAFGYGAKTAGQVASQLMIVGGLSATAALETQTFTAAMAQAAGVAPGKVMKDIAENSKVMAKFMAGNAKLMTETAIAAAKTGMSVADMAKVAEGLLDIEGSLTKQYEAQALLGRELNFDRARQLALEGNIADATAEVLAQAGDYNDLTNMSFLQRKKVAEAAGLEVDQLMKAAKLAEITANMSAEQRDMVEASGLSMAQLNNMSSDQILATAAANANVEKMEGIFQELSNVFINSLLPVLTTIGEILLVAFTPISIAVNALRALVDLAREYSMITAGVLTITTLILAKQQEQAILGAAQVVREGIINAYKAGRLVIENLISGALFKQAGLALLSIGRTAIEGAMTLAKGVAAIFGTFAQIPFGLGIPLAIAAVGGLMAMYTSAVSKKQMGGPVTGGNPYLVGESGPELFTPAANGNITSNAELKRNGNANKAPAIDYKQMAQAIVSALATTPIAAVLAEDVPARMAKNQAIEGSYN